MRSKQHKLYTKGEECDFTFFWISINAGIPSTTHLEKKKVVYRIDIIN